MSSVVTLALLALLGADDGTYLDAPVVPGATPTGEPGRYESPKTYDDTLTHYKWYFKTRGGVRWRNVVNLPQIRAKHIESTRPKTRWQGLNIYEMQGKVRIFVVPRDPEAKAAPKPKK